MGVFAVIGVLSVVGGLVTIVRPSLGSETGLGYGFVTVLGVIVLAASLRYWVGLALTTVESATPPAPEDRTRVSVPGVDFDRQVTDSRAASVLRLRARQDVADRLRSVAERIAERAHGGREDGSDAGDWREDAAGSLPEVADSEGSLRDRFTTVRTGQTAFQRRVSASVAELARRHDGEAAAVELEAPAETPTTVPSEPGLRPTDRWKLLRPMALTAVGVGVVFGSAALLLVGALFGGLGVYAAAGSPPAGSVRIRRSIDPVEPTPGESVRVTIEIENVGEQFLPDLRVIDRVPAGLSVTDGSPRHGTALRPGATATYEYRAAALRGNHEFGEACVLTRNLSGTFERVADLDVEGDRAATYDVRAVMDRSVPLGSQTVRSVGRLVTDVGGSGIELHAVREYRSGDPLNRIDWSRVAAGEGLATLQFREERAATVVMLVDARAAAYVAPDPDEPSAVDRSVLAAAATATALLAADDRVGLGALSPRQCFLAPSSGHAHRTRIHQSLAESAAFDPRPPDSAFKPAIRLKSIRKRLPAEAQLLVFSPVCDDEIVDVVRRLRASGHSTTVISPDVTGGRTPGRTLASIERDLRLSRLRGADVRVVDWDPADPLALALEAAERWS
ncbi:MAG: DUF58 domain-containing protein [Haloferacaceae archaeon]